MITYGFPFWEIPQRHKQLRRMKDYTGELAKQQKSALGNSAVWYLPCLLLILRAWTSASVYIDKWKEAALFIFNHKRQLEVSKQRRLDDIKYSSSACN